MEGCNSLFSSVPLRVTHDVSVSDSIDIQINLNPTHLIHLSSILQIHESESKKANKPRDYRRCVINIGPHSGVHLSVRAHLSSVECS